MSKTAIPVDPEKLQTIIQTVEVMNGGAFSNRNELFEAVAATEWAKNHQPKPLTKGVIYLRFNEFNLNCATPKGKRGRQKGCSPSVNRTPRREKLKTFAKSFNKMRDSIDKRFHPRIDKAQDGSMKAALELKCITCSGMSTSEVGQCHIDDCPLYPFRPFQPTESK
jgi:hypothetical protein